MVEKKFIKGLIKIDYIIDEWIYSSRKYINFDK